VIPCQVVSSSRITAIRRVSSVYRLGARFLFFSLCLTIKLVIRELLLPRQAEHEHPSTALRSLALLTVAVSSAAMLFAEPFSPPILGVLGEGYFEACIAVPSPLKDVVGTSTFYFFSVELVSIPLWRAISLCFSTTVSRPAW